jgi:repressor protein
MYNTEKLKKLRIKQKLTIYDISSKIGISPSHYSLIENGKRKLSYEMAIKIAKVFHTTPDKLFLS